ncbi:hypothetical protein [Bacillus cereus]|uniref:hypothetical protein n=1 Tax=Bacillus cereus TaxID=1396 RepID=UPI00397FD30B
MKKIGSAFSDGGMICKTKYIDFFKDVQAKVNVLACVNSSCDKLKAWWVIVVFFLIARE